MTNKETAGAFRRVLVDLISRAAGNCNRYPDYEPRWAMIAAELAKVDRLVSEMLTDHRRKERAR